MKASMFFLLLALSSPAALVHEPDSDPDASWFSELKNRGVSCCNTQDCHRTETWGSTTAGLYKVKLKDEWVTVQPQNVLHVPNPTGFAIECHQTEKDGLEVPYIRCFVPPAGV